MTTSGRILHMRRLAGLTQLQAAKGMGWKGAQTWYQYENGIKRPGYAVIVRMARVLDCDPGELFD